MEFCFSSSLADESPPLGFVPEPSLHFFQHWALASLTMGPRCHPSSCSHASSEWISRPLTVMSFFVHQVALLTALCDSRPPPGADTTPGARRAAPSCTGVETEAQRGKAFGAQPFLTDGAVTTLGQAGKVASYSHRVVLTSRPHCSQRFGA